MTEPMSDKRQAAIEAEAQAIQVDIDRADGMGCDDSKWMHRTFHAYARDVSDLIAEVKRLRAEVERERETRTQEHNYAGADAEASAQRIRELITQNMTLRVKLEREEAEHAAMREIVQQVAALELEYRDEHSEFFCPACQAFVSADWGTGRKPRDMTGLEWAKHRIKHEVNCSVTKARAIVAQWDTHEEPSDPAR